MYDVYRDGQKLPAEVVAHPSRVDEVKEALAALDLPRLPVRGSGGCLATEVWLEVPER